MGLECTRGARCCHRLRGPAAGAPTRPHRALEDLSLKALISRVVIRVSSGAAQHVTDGEGADQIALTGLGQPTLELGMASIWRDGSDPSTLGAFRASEKRTLRQRNQDPLTDGQSKLVEAGATAAAQHGIDDSIASPFAAAEVLLNMKAEGGLAEEPKAFLTDRLGLSSCCNLSGTSSTMAVICSSSQAVSTKRKRPVRRSMRTHSQSGSGQIQRPKPSSFGANTFKPALHLE